MATVFKDINLKFAIISCLDEPNSYIDEAKRIKFVEYDKSSFTELSYDSIVPAVYIYLKKLEIQKIELEKIIEFNPSASNECYNLLVKEWSGEDDIFDIKSLDGIENLPNLEIFNPFGLLDYEVNIKALLKCKKLRTVHQKFLPQTEDIKKDIEKLKKRGVEIE